MSLTSGSGPLGTNRAGRFSAEVPADLAYVEPFRRRVRAEVGGRTVVDTERALLVHRPGGPPVWAFPEPDATGVPSVPVPEVAGHVEVPWSAVDRWLQEEDEVRLHAPNPYHRVECVRTARRLRVEVQPHPGHRTVLVDGPAALAVFETSLEPRLYVAREAVRDGVLVPSPTVSHCPYKGDASWWSAVVDGVEVADVAWSYEDPLPESAAIAGLLGFAGDGDRVTVTDDVPPVSAALRPRRP